MKISSNSLKISMLRTREKNHLFPSDQVSKKNLTWEVAKKIISCFFRTIAVLFYSFFYLDSRHYVYLKSFISNETSS